MSDTKKDQNEDIVASAEDTPEVIGDESLEQTAGGWSFGSSSVVMSGGSTMLNTNLTVQGPIAETIYAGDSDDVLQTADTSFLRTRPGRIGNW